MSRKLKKIRAGHDRAVLSDTLPFEVPITFSNHGMYQFLSENRVEIREDGIVWKKKSIAEEILVKLLFGIPLDKAIGFFSEWVGEENYVFCRIPIEKNKMATSPYKFSIKHKEDSFRQLSVPHPLAQCQMAGFFRKYSQTILYFCNRSSISLRRPSKVATKVYFNDGLHKKRKDHMFAGAEQAGSEYTALRSYFVYSKYNNIYKFYESYEFHRAEKKYNKLLKLDVSKCFDSIYTHSTAWAVFGKEKIKRQFLGSDSKSIDDSFPDKLDRVMQMANSRETNGILIGPEFSRVFAEIIFQHIDALLLRSIAAVNPDIKPGRDFSAFRYIDDYFIFFNDDETRKIVLKQLGEVLSEFKLHLNEEKAKLYEKPLITEITIAKESISLLFSDILQVNRVDASGEDSLSLQFDSRKAITSIKAIVKTADVSYRDIQNWTLAVLETRLSRVLSLCAKEKYRTEAKLKLTPFLISILDFLFFVYSVSPRVNTTIRLCRTLTVALQGAASIGVGSNNIHSLRRQIFEDINVLLRKSRSSEFTQVETMYLILQVAELGKQFQFSEQEIMYFFRVEGHNPETVRRLDYFSLTTLLFYLKDRRGFDSLRSMLLSDAHARISDAMSNKELKWNTEVVLLLFDLLGCPYVPKSMKKRVLRDVGVRTSYSRDKIASMEQQWFTRWTNFSFSKQLDAKKSLEVY